MSTAATRLAPSKTIHRRFLSEKELAATLESHQRFVKSGGTDGRLADLTGVDLRGADLSHQMLAGCNLEKANLTGANLVGVNLNGANVRDAIFWHAEMTDASLKDVAGLVTRNLAGADVCCTTLPDAVAQFSELDNISEASKNALITFVTMLSAALYDMVALSSSGLVKHSSEVGKPDLIQLPFWNVDIAIPSFNIIAPVLLLAIYVYFHLQLLRLWELLAELPAIFPDGISLEKKAYPWLFNGVVTAYLPLLINERPRWWRAQASISLFLGCALVPMTLARFWCKSLSSHSHYTAALYGTLTVLTVWLAVYFHGLGKATLCHRKDSFSRANLATGLSVAIVVYFSCVYW